MIPKSGNRFSDKIMLDLKNNSSTVERWPGCSDRVEQRDDVPAVQVGRAATAHLVAEHAGGRTILRRQHVPYPFHLTRGFHLDDSRPDLLTLYMQSASGGLYAHDRMGIELAVEAGAALHLTTQAATVVRDGKEVGAHQRQAIRVGAGGFCAMIGEPYILFPNAGLRLETTACVADDAVFLLADGFAVHDPRGRGACFAAFESHVRIERPDGTTILRDGGRVHGDELAQSYGPLGGFAACATMMVIAPRARVPDAAVLQDAVDDVGCLAGVCAAPFDAGLVLRLLAPDGGTLARGLEAAFHAASRAALGFELARRRK